MVKKGCKQTEEHKKHLSESLKGRIVSEETKVRIRKNMEGKPSPCPGAFKGHKHTEEYKKYMSEKHSGENNPMYGIPAPNKGKKASTELRKKLSVSAKIRANTPEYKARISALSKEIWNDPVFRENQSIIKSGENSLFWKGGISFEPYCPKFNNRFREYVRIKFNRTCACCGKPEELNFTATGRKYKLAVHHIDYDKLDICNGKSWSFVPLCIPCHIKTCNNRWYWFNLLINYWILNINIHLSLNDVIF